MNILAVDPGYEQSAYVIFTGARVLEHGIEPNAVLLSRFRDSGREGLLHTTAVVFEQFECFGMAVGREVFETVFWTGRLFEAVSEHKDPACRVERMTRRIVKSHLCHNTRAQDSNIRVALVDRFGGADRAVGKKATPGPLYGIKSHEWAALAIAVTYWELNTQPPVEAHR